MSRMIKLIHKISDLDTNLMAARAEVSRLELELADCQRELEGIFHADESTEQPEDGPHTEPTPKPEAVSDYVQPNGAYSETD